MRDINVKVAKIKEMIERKVRHPYLERYLPTPLIDEDKLFLLCSMFVDTQISESKLEEYFLTIMLVQIALDTHEQVTIEQALDKKMKKRQLTVLAGDYYSGLYYYILADLNNIPMIKVLAEGIKEVNEYKINLYQIETDQIDNIVGTLKMLESSIFIKIANFFKLNVWTEFVSSTLLFKRLINERELFIQQEYSIVFDALMKQYQKNDSLKFKSQNEYEQYLLLEWDNYINQTKLTILELLKQLPIQSSGFQKQIESILLQYNFSIKKVAEEG